MSFIWLSIAVLRNHLGDAAYPAGLSGAFEQASRFFYVLLYFPLADWYHERRDDSAHRIWLWPVYAVCAVTWLLFVPSLSTLCETAFPVGSMSLRART